MSERENLLLRWARLKTAAKAAEEIDGASAGSEAMAVPEAPFDPASLPSIEFNCGGYRHHCIFACRRAGRVDPRGLAQGLDERSGYSGLHWDRGQPVGF